MIRLRHLAPGQIQTFYAAEFARGQSPATVQKTHQVLHAALEQALREGLVTRNAAGLTTRPRARRRGVAIWDVEQLALFLGTVRRDNPARYPLFLFTLGTGLSMGEGLGLLWHDIDWIQKTATIR
jgi:integrase